MFSFTSTFLRNSKRFLSTKDVNLVKGVVNQDMLLQNLKYVTSVENVLDLVTQHHQIMNSNHLMQAFRALFTLQKNQPNISNELKNQTGFKTLCITLKRQIRAIEPNQLIESVKILTYLKVASNSSITQTVLQMIRCNVNNLTLAHIIFLDFILAQMEPTPLSDALLIALPIVFEAQIRTKLNVENIAQLSDCLQYVSKKPEISQNVVDYLVDCMSNCTEMYFEPRNAFRIVWSLCDLKPKYNFGPVLKKALDSLSEKDSLTITDLETLLTKLSFRYNHKYPFYYHKRLFNTIADYVIEHNLGFQQTVWILQKFTKLGFTSDRLLDYLTSLCQENSKLITNTRPWNLFAIVTAFSNTSHRPVHWESIRNAIFEYENYHETNQEFNWFKFATRLAMLDIFIPDVLSATFRPEHVEKTLEGINNVNCYYFLLLYQTISVLHPEYKDVLPHSSCVEKTLSRLPQFDDNTEDVSFQAALEQGFGGKNYVLTNVTTKLGQLFQHAVVMRKGGYPVAVNIQQDKQFVQLEDIQVPEDSHIIAIMVCQPSYYRPESNVLKSYYNYTYQLIEASGYSVVPISIQMWYNLPDYEKIPYLMQLIKVKNEQHEENMYAIQ